ncbi:hypothetical protein [Sphingobacterium lactis]
MKLPKFTDRQLWAFRWFFLYPALIILIGRLIIFFVLLYDSTKQ